MLLLQMKGDRMFEAKKLTWEDWNRIVDEEGLVLPIEQTEVWANYQNTVDGRTFWGCLSLEGDGKTRALLSLFDYETHGYHYLRSHHAPMWLGQPTPAEEQEALQALVAYVRKHDSQQVFMRIAVDGELDMTRPVLSSIPYDTTVVIDLTGGDDEILTRMKPRGRRDVRKALREAPATCADETDLALNSFAEYYQIMVETAQRDGFSPAPQEEYEKMLRMLGPEHCRVFAGRLEDGSVCTWSICTVSGVHGTRYYAASRNDTMRLHVTDKLVYFECCELAKLGCTEYDLMAIGSDFSPTLKGLNEFKTKFSKEVTHVAPDRDVPIKGAFYQSLRLAKAAKQQVGKLRHG